MAAMGSKRIVVVGAGLGGLSAACNLRGQGHDVTVVERASVPGGRAGLIESMGYRMDPGPCVLTMTGILSDVFTSVGARMSDHVAIEPLDPMYRAVFDESEGGGELRVRHGREAMAEEIRSFAGSDAAAGFHKFADWVTELYNVEMPAFIDRNFDSPLDMARPLLPGLKLLKLGGFAKLSNLVGKYFDDPRLQKIFSFQAMYAGLSPFEALGAYAVITYMDTIAGVYFPRGGMHAISTGLAEAATAAGVKIRYNATVERVVRAAGTNGAVRGVRLDGGEMITADVVVLNADLPVAYKTLLPEIDAPRVARRGQFSPSCALWLAGVKGGLPEGAEHHNIHFGGQWRQAFDSLLKQGTRMADPSLLVTVPSKTDATLVPASVDGVARQSLYVLEPTPHLGGRINWDTERERIKSDIFGRVQRLGYVGSESDVEVEYFLDPNDWERQGMAMGTPFALAHTFFQTGPFRPSNVDKRVPGLVFVGSSTVPGVGVPMVLLSGRLAAERVAEMV
jgi:phytoene desaturase